MKLEKFAFFNQATMKLKMIQPTIASYYEYGGVHFQDAKKRLISYTAKTNDVKYLIPSSVKVIGECAFMNQLSLQEVVIPLSVKVIGDYAFANCKALVTTLPKQLEYLGSYAFVGCNSLKTIRIPEKVSEIGVAAFANCRGLEKIEVDETNEFYRAVDGVLYDYQLSTIVAFPCNYRFSSVTLPKTILYVLPEAFGYCNHLASFKTEENSLFIESIDGVLFFNNGQILVKYPNQKKEGDYEIPKETKMIFEGAFFASQYLESVKLPQGLYLINSKMFEECLMLDTVIIPSSVKIIEEKAFKNCQRLQNIQLPQGLAVIGKCAFANCQSIKTIVIPKSVKEMDEDVFKGWTKEQTIIIECNEVNIAQWNPLWDNMCQAKIIIKKED